jgi:cystathionine beta-lyase
MKRWTELIHFEPSGDEYQANTPPLYQTATFAQKDLADMCEYDYSRSGNPTRTLVQNKIAKLECGTHAFLFNSGMAALNAITFLLSSGDHIIAGDDAYGGTHRLLSQCLPKCGIHCSFVDTTNIDAVRSSFTDNTRLLLIETPTNPLHKISDIQQLAEIAHENNACLVVDNTFLSPWLQQPLLFGADIVVHSATKHLGGHSDLTAGVVVVNNDALAKKIAFIQNAEGGALSPFDSWLLLKGLKTLGLRIEREQENAIYVANYLKNHPAVTEIYYSGFEDHPGHALHKQQSRGPGTIISFECESSAFAKKFVSTVKIFKLSVSFGSLNSLICLPSLMSHASVPEEMCQFTNKLIRLSIGIEDVDDLIADLEQAFTTTLNDI